MSRPSPETHSDHSESGLTLVELIVTMVVMTIVLSIGTYSFRGFTNRNAVNAAANDLLAAINLTRSEAVTRGQVVSLCRSADPTADNNPATPAPSCTIAGGSGWETGFIIFADNDGDGVRDANEELIRSFADFGQVTMSGNTFVADALRFQASGFFVSPGNGTITAINPDGSRKVEILISKMGRARIQ
jgi:type IV fimbrial biogenesis protein FimT